MKKRFFAFAIWLSFLVCLSGCGREKDAVDLLRTFSASYGTVGVMYSPAIPEGEVGYMGSELYAALYGEDALEPQSYAILLSPSLSEVGECGVFLCGDTYEAARICEMCLDRIALIRSVSYAGQIESGEGAFVRRFGTAVVYGFLDDGERAERIWKRLL